MIKAVSGGVGRVLSLTPRETAFERNKKSVFMRVCRLSKSGKCLQIGVTVSRFSLGQLWVKLDPVNEKSSLKNLHIFGNYDYFH